MLKCQKCRNNGDYICRHDVVGTPRKEQEIIGYGEIKEKLLRLIKDSFQRSKDPAVVANVSATLLGDFGMGKTALANFFVDAINHSEYETLLVNLAEDGLTEDALLHFDTTQMKDYKGAAIVIDARTVADYLQVGQVSDYMTPFFQRMGAIFAIAPELKSVSKITEAILKKQGAERLFVFIDEMEGLKETQYGLDFDQFFKQFTNDLRTLINGTGIYEVHNKLTMILCTVPNVWDEFRRREDIAGGLLTREYAEPFMLQRFDLKQSYDFVGRICHNWKNSPFDEKSVRTLHLVADGRPRLLTKLCGHIQSRLPGGDDRLTANYTLANTILTSLENVIGLGEQLTYAFDPTSFKAITTYLQREFSKVHAHLFGLLVAKYGEYTNEELAQVLRIDIPQSDGIVRALSDQKSLVLGLRLISRGHLFDFADLATAKAPRAMIDNNFMDDSEVKFSKATGDITIFGRLSYFRDVLPPLTVKTMDGTLQIFVPFHADDLSLLWNLSDHQADKLGKGLRSSGTRGTLSYRLSEPTRNRLFPVASQADLPFLSKEKYYELRNKVHDLTLEQKRNTLATGILKILESQDVDIADRMAVDTFDFEVNHQRLKEKISNFNGTLSLKARVLMIDSEDAFEKENLQNGLINCDFGLLVCIRKFGDNHVLLMESKDDNYGPYRPAIVRTIQSTKLETNLLVLGQTSSSDIAIENEYELGLDKLYRELEFDSVLDDWHKLGLTQGFCLQEWRMTDGTTREVTRKTLLDLIRVLPSLPTTLDEAKSITQKDFGYRATALPKWEGIQDLVDLGFVSQDGKKYDVLLSPTEVSILQIIKHSQLNPALRDNTSKVIAKEIEPFFWNFTSNPKIEELIDYIEILEEKGLLVQEDEAKAKQMQQSIFRLFDKAEKKDEYGSTIKKYCDVYARNQHKRTLAGMNKSSAYFAKHYTDLLETAVKPAEVNRASYCASAFFSVYRDLATLYQEGESRHKAIKQKIDQAKQIKDKTVAQSTLIIGSAEVDIEIKGETDDLLQNITENIETMTTLHGEGSADTENVTALFTTIKESGRHLKDIYQTIKDQYSSLQERYDQVKGLAKDASQSPHRNQIKQDRETIQSLDPNKQFRDSLYRYQKFGKEPGDSAVSSYSTKLDNLRSKLQNFLDNQKSIKELSDLHSRAKNIFISAEEFIENLKEKKLQVEGGDRLLDNPLFFKSLPKDVMNELNMLLKGLEQQMNSFSQQDIDSIKQVVDQLDKFEVELSDHSTNVGDFENAIHQLNYDLESFFAPQSLAELERAYNKFIDDSKYQLQKTLQSIYQQETYKTANALITDSLDPLVREAQSCLERLMTLDKWFGYASETVKTERFQSTTAFLKIKSLIEKIKKTKGHLLKEFPDAVDKVSRLLSSTQKKTEGFEDEFTSLSTESAEECTQQVEDSLKILNRFDVITSPIRGEITDLLERSTAFKNDGFYAQALKTAKQATEQLIACLEKTQNSQSVKLQIVLILQPNLKFKQIVAAYETRFKTSFGDEEAQALLMLLQEDKIDATFSL